MQSSQSQSPQFSPTQAQNPVSSAITHPIHIHHPLSTLNSSQNRTQRITTHIHPSPRTTLLPHLLSSLPYTLPIVRRIQFHLQTPEHAFCIATWAPGRNDDNGDSATGVTELPNQYAAAYLDRSRAPETECWIYCSVERTINERGEDVTSAEERETGRRQILALLEHVRRVSEAMESRREDGEGKGNRYLLCGSVAKFILEGLKGGELREGDDFKVVSVVNGAAGSMERNSDRIESEKSEDEDGSQTHKSRKEEHTSRMGVIRGHTVPYAKFIFPPGGFEVDSEDDLWSGREGLPDNMRWTRVRQDEFELVRSRTEIPRKDRTLVVLPNVGIRLSSEYEADDSGRLIAWGFLGADASLTSLHVEDEFRGKGLAKHLTRRVFALLTKVPNSRLTEGHSDKGLPVSVPDPRKCYVGVVDGQDYCHSDVAQNNLASVGVAKALGGTKRWECFWTLVDLDAIPKAVLRVAKLNEDFGVTNQ